MDQRYRDSNVDLLVNKLIKAYSDQINSASNDLPDSSHFTLRLRHRINNTQDRPFSNVWEYGVVSAQRWLFAFSLLAVLFFVGNLVVFGLKPSFTTFSNQLGHSTDLEIGDYEEESLNFIDMSQE